MDDAPRIVCSGDAAGPVAPRLLGGKGSRLLDLERDGFPVPPFLCITTAVFADAVRGLEQTLQADLSRLEGLDRSQAGWRDAISAAAAAARDRVKQAGLPERDRQRILEQFDQTFASGSRVAVRSSIVGEDSASDSFAGQMDTYLFVERDQLLDSIVSCFASAYTDRALLYRAMRGRDRDPIEAAVVVQAMVDSVCAGVAFTVDPTTGDRSVVVTSAGLGVGEGVVSGTVETDTYYTDKASFTLRRSEIVAKKTRAVFDREAATGTQIEPVPSELSAPSVLSDEQVREVARLAARVEETQALPQDIEWAIDARGRLYLLQARPVTTIVGGRTTIFDNSNIVESYPGVSLPLTFSFVRDAYHATFREAMRMFGVSETVLEAESALFDNLVALVDGQIYYNILNWYRLFQLLEMERALPAWEKALGLEGGAYRPPPKSFGEKLRATPTMLRIRAHIVGNLFVLNRAVRRYLADLERVQTEARERDVDQMDAHELLDLAEQAVRRLQIPYGISVVNDFYTQQFHALLRKLIERWSLGDVDELSNALLAGETDMHSVAPVRSMLELAGQAREQDALRELLESDRSETAIWDAIHRQPELESFRRRMQEHFSLYGDRTLHELKLETPPMDQNPVLVVTMLRNYLRAGRSPLDFEQTGVRSAAEGEVRKRLARRPLRRNLFDLVLRSTRATVKNRENLRLARTRGFGILKRIFRAVGRLLAAQGFLDQADDLFYLTVDEMKGAVRGHLVTRDLRALVELRKREYEGYRGKELAPRITVNGMVYRNAFPSAVFDRGARTAAGDIEAPNAELRGLGCSAGVARAPAKVVLQPDSDLKIDGEILVAPMTDPGWVFLMVSASGLVVEKGSLLSHTAIIGRELGVPTVVGVADATKLIRDGCLVEVDGRAGTVRIDPRDPA